MNIGPLRLLLYFLNKMMYKYGCHMQNENIDCAYHWPVM